MHIPMEVGCATTTSSKIDFSTTAPAPFVLACHRRVEQTCPVISESITCPTGILISLSCRLTGWHWPKIPRRNQKKKRPLLVRTGLRKFYELKLFVSDNFNLDIVQIATVLTSYVVTIRSDCNTRGRRNTGDFVAVRRISIRAAE